MLIGKLKILISENNVIENTETVDKEDENSVTENEEIEKTEIINEVEKESETETTSDIPEIMADESKSEKKDESDLNAIQIDETGELKWYAVRIISGHENKVKLYLDNQIKSESYEDKIRNVLIPLEKVFEVKNGKKKD